ncbi:MAG: DNA-processing protein DprA [Chitinophagales bacterium]|nr:DNA-processing protein DprA [Chitinophagales bacterium]
MDRESQLYRIALTFLPTVGDILLKNLVSYCGGVREVFNASFTKLKKAPGIGERRAKEILHNDVLKRAEEELAFVERNDISTLFYLDADYPKRLSNCYDNPILLYYKGNADLNAQKVLSIVGTRTATEYGKAVSEQIVEALAEKQVLIVSGMAYGIDIYAHRAALKVGLPTVGVFGHGLDIVYPAQHRSTAEKMLSNGGLLTDFPSKSKFEKGNFPRRNRIVAGLADATIVVETKVKGGSMITAEIANSYDRDVFAVPGNINASNSQGCNYLIKTNRAYLLDEVEELLEILGWKENTLSPPVQKQLFLDLNEDETKVVELLKEKPLAIDELSFRLLMPASLIAANLLNLELKGVIRSLPGKVYELA